MWPARCRGSLSVAQRSGHSRAEPRRGETPMSDLPTRLSEILNAAVETRSVAGVAITAGAGAQPQAVWSPAMSHDEPAFLAYSITKTFTAALLLLLGEERRVNLDD